MSEFSYKDGIEDGADVAFGAAFDLIDDELQRREIVERSRILSNLRAAFFETLIRLRDSRRCGEW